jgi:hypothetical protein
MVRQRRDDGDVRGFTLRGQGSFGGRRPAPDRVWISVGVGAQQRMGSRGLKRSTQEVRHSSEMLKWGRG